MPAADPASFGVTELLVALSHLWKLAFEFTPNLGRPQCWILQTFRGSTEQEFTGWITTILHHRLRNALRDNRAGCRNIQLEVPLPNAHDSAALIWHEPASRQSTASKRFIRGERALRLAAALDKLSAEQALAVKLRFLEGWALKELARRMDKTSIAVAGLLKRGLAKLRASLAESSLL